jgi:flagellar hook-associated protein 1 FlgK
VGTFDGLSVALSGLYAQRQGMEVAAQNVANASTAGYTRQRVSLQSVGSLAVPDLWSSTRDATGGVMVAGVDRVQDPFLDSQVRDSHAVAADLTASAGAMASVEQVFTEPSDTGLADALSTFFSAFHDVANQPADLGVRSSLLQKAAAVTDWMSSASSRLTAQSQALGGQAVSIVSEIDATAARLADLNQTIARAVPNGVQANELADQRDQLALRLSELVGGTVTNDASGNVNVRLGGRELVTGSTANVLTTSQVAGRTVVSWADDGSTATIPGGQLGGVLDSANTTIPQWSARLDQVAASLASQVNALHQSGYDLTGAAGGPLFSGTTAATVTVAITDPRRLAASAVAPTASGPSLDVGIADRLGALAGTTTGPAAVYGQLVADLGVAAKSVQDRLSTQAAVVSSVDAAQSSVSGVSIDEEMTSIVAYQRAYEASSRVLTAVDSLLDTLINRTGLVGRG